MYNDLQNTMLRLISVKEFQKMPKFDPLKIHSLSYAENEIF